MKKSFGGQVDIKGEDEEGSNAGGIPRWDKREDQRV